MTDVKKLSEEFALRPLPPEVFTAAQAFRNTIGDEQTTEVMRVIERAAYEAGFRAALECEEVAGMRTDLVVVRDFVSEGHKRLLTQVIDGFDRLLKGVKA